MYDLSSHQVLVFVHADTVSPVGPMPSWRRVSLSLSLSLSLSISLLSVRVKMKGKKVGGRKGFRV